MRVDAGLLIGLALGWHPLAGAGAADMAYGEYLAGECMTCHHTHADAAIPPIHALPPADFIRALEEYQDGTRTHALMQTVARSLGKAEMEALAAYFQQRRD